MIAAGLDPYSEDPVNRSGHTLTELVCSSGRAGAAFMAVHAYRGCGIGHVGKSCNLDAFYWCRENF